METPTELNALREQAANLFFDPDNLENLSVREDVTLGERQNFADSVKKWVGVPNSLAWVYDKEKKEIENFVFSWLMPPINILYCLRGSKKHPEGNPSILRETHYKGIDKDTNRLQFCKGIDIERLPELFVELRDWYLEHHYTGKGAKPKVAEPIEGFPDMPNASVTKAVDAVLKGTGMPKLSNMYDKLTQFDAVCNDLDKEKKSKKSLLQQAANRKAKLKKELSGVIASLQAQLEEHSFGTQGSIDVDVPDVGEVEGTFTFTPAVEVFGSSMKEFTNFSVPVWTWTHKDTGEIVKHPDTPEVDEHYIFRSNELYRTLYALVSDQRAYFSGHTGTGKTTLIQQVAAKLNWPFMAINFDSEISRMDLIGRDTLTKDVSSGDTVSKFVDGILPQAMVAPYIMVCDELDFIRPDVAYVMQRPLEGNGMVITEDGGRRVEPHPMFRMFATGNTVGQGDEHGMYQGARPQSLALLDRFTVWCNVDYLEPKARQELLERKVPSLQRDKTGPISEYVTEHIEAFKSSKVLQPISPRGMIAIGKTVVALQQARGGDDKGVLKEALTMVVLDKASSSDRSVLQGIVDRIGG